MYNAMEDSTALAGEQWVVDGLLAANKRKATLGAKFSYVNAAAAESDGSSRET